MPKTPTRTDTSGSTTDKSSFPFPAVGPFAEYVIDATQRTILFWDVLRQRSEQYYAHKAMEVPHVLTFDAELVLDAGRQLGRGDGMAAEIGEELVVRAHAFDPEQRLEEPDQAPLEGAEIRV